MCLHPRLKFENKNIPPRLLKRSEAFQSDLERIPNPYEANPCLCGNTNDYVVAEYDRYGIPLRTVLCMECGLMRSDPYYTKSVLELFYSKYYRDIYSEEGPVDVWKRQSQLAGSAEDLDVLEDMVKPGGKIFEVGCGPGGILKWFADRDFEVYGCDFDRSYLEYGRQFGLSLEEGGVESLEKYGKADLIIINHVLEHVRNPVGFLEDVAERLLGPGGVLYIGVPGIYSLPSLMKLGIRHPLGISVRLDPLQYFQNAHVYHYTLDTLRYVAAKANLKCIWGTEVINSVFMIDKSVSCPVHPCMAQLIKRRMKKVEYVYQSYVKQKNEN